MMCVCCDDMTWYDRLSDSMSALEVLDPKMDSCMNHETHMTLTRAKEQHVLPQHLTLKQQVAMIDALLCLEVGYGYGYVVSLNVMSICEVSCHVMG